MPKSDAIVLSPRALNRALLESLPRQSGTRDAPAPRSRAAMAGLTDREVEVLRLVAGGLSNQTIGERLFVSEHTVKTHAARLVERLSAQRRTQAVQRAKEAGLIP